MTPRRPWLPFASAAAVAALVLAAVLVPWWLGREEEPRCSTAVPGRTPLLPPDRFDADPRLGTLADAVDAMAAPFGAVRAGVGYNYDQWLHLYAAGDGLVAFTKRNAAVTMLDGDGLGVRWAREPAAKRIAWDASADRLALLNLTAQEDVRVASIDLRTGEEQWCRRLTTRHRDGQPVSTAFLPDGDLLVVLPVGDGLDLARLSGADGHVRWYRQLEGVGRADHLSVVDDDTVLVGGVESFRLAEAGDGDETIPADGFATYAVEDGDLVRAYPAPLDGPLHVVGRAGDLVVSLSRAGSRTALVGTGLDARRRWIVDPGTVDVALRGGVVLARTPKALVGYRAADGTRLWSRPLPQDRTVFPYGFTLAQMPSLDEPHVLMPTTTSLEVLDVATGKSAPHALPTDGVSTTYWPYQLAVTPDAIAVVTNTGGVVAARD